MDIENRIYSFIYQCCIFIMSQTTKAKLHLRWPVAASTPVPWQNPFSSLEVSQ